MDYYLYRLITLILINWDVYVSFSVMVVVDTELDGLTGNSRSKKEDLRQKEFTTKSDPDDEKDKVIRK